MTWQPNHNEQQSAKELDQLITALQQGKQTPPQHEDGQMAQQLVQLAATIQPNQPFVNSLRAQLAAQANQKSQSNKGVTLPSIIEEWVKHITMKRTLVTLAGVTAVLVLAIVGWNLFRPASGGVEPATEIAAAPTETENMAGQEVVKPEVEAVATEPGVTEANTASEAGVVEQPIATEAVTTGAADAPLTPAFSGVRGLGGGGGGGYGFGEGQSPFTTATLTLNAELPQETEAAVYAAAVQNSTTLDQEMVRAFAEKMAVSGEMYFEWYSGMPINGQDDGSGNLPYVYRIFDGKRQVTAYLGGEMFYEDTTFYSQNLPPLPYADRAAIAEQYLQDRNLLDFTYEIHPGWGNEVQFLPLVDGRPVNNWSLLTVNVAGDGQIMSVSIRPLSDLDQIQIESLRSAADAWQYLQDNLAEGPVMFNLIASDPAYYAPPVSDGEKTHWDREYTSGQEVTLNSWVQIFRPADGSVTPRMVTDRGILLAADDATLEAIAETVSNGNNVRLQGVLSGEADNLTLNVSNWEAITGPFDVYLNGTTRLIDGAVSLELPGGFPIQIANPPADLPIDSFVSMSSWSVRIADDGVSAITDWVTFDLMNYFVDPGVSPEDPFSNISGVMINKVDLVFNFLYPYESLNPSTGVPFIGDDNGHLAPVWRFTGETNKGDLVEFIIPAPASVELPAAPTE
jgi:hypothetical protein